MNWRGAFHNFCLVLVMLLIVQAFFACGGRSTSEEEIRIGVIAYLRGNQVESEGQPTVNAVTMAAQSVNDAGGLDVGGRKYKIVLIIEGVEDVPEEAVTAAIKLINQKKVIAIVGPQFSADAIPAGSVAEASRVPMICPISTNIKTTAGRKYVFRMSFDDDFQGKIMAKFAQEELGARTAAALYDVADPYSRSLAEVFRKEFEGSGGRVVSFESYTTGEKDFTQQLKRIQGQQSDVLFLPNQSQDALIQARQARRFGINAHLLGSDGWDRKIFQSIPEFRGAFMSAHWSRDLEGDHIRSFVSNYRRTFKQEASDTAALTYDAINMVFKAIQNEGQADPQSIKDGLYNLGPYSGVSGMIDFKDSGDPKKGVVILHFKGGKHTFYGLIFP